MRSKTDKPYERVLKLMSDMKEIEKQADALKSKLASKDSSSIIDSAKDINGVKVLAYRQDNLEQKDLRVLADNVRDRLGSGVILIASAKDDQASMLAMVTKDIVQKVKAGDILKQVAELCGAGEEASLTWRRAVQKSSTSSTRLSKLSTKIVEKSLT
jgi:alanyl-tRNA synthetase